MTLTQLVNALKLAGVGALLACVLYVLVAAFGSCTPGPRPLAAMREVADERCLYACVEQATRRFDSIDGAGVEKFTELCAQQLAGRRCCQSARTSRLAIPCDEGEVP